MTAAEVARAFVKAINGHDVEMLCPLIVKDFHRLMFEMEGE